MSDLILEIVEGPGAGRQVPLAGALEVGRDASAGVALDDGLVSRRHVRLSPSDEGALAEDLDSLNGTFVNGEQIHAPTPLRAGDQVLVGVTVLELRSAAQVEARPTAAVAIPPGLAVAPRAPDYIAPGIAPAASRPAPPSPLDALLDVHTKAKARTAPLALLALTAFAVIVFLATR